MRAAPQFNGTRRPTRNTLSSTSWIAPSLHQGLVCRYDPAPLGPREPVLLSASSLCLDGALRDYLDREYPSGLYRHQEQALRHVLRGENTIVATQTSSGKSLVYSIPVYQALLRDPAATALFIYPQKALANDQQLKLRAFAEALSPLKKMLAEHPHLVSRYDGATEGAIRGEIRDQVQIALTNPDMLHMGILQYHERHWSRFFGNLKYVILDECHEYRGIFGTNVAYILRRLRQPASRTAHPRRSSPLLPPSVIRRSTLKN